MICGDLRAGIRMLEGCPYTLLQPREGTSSLKSCELLNVIEAIRPLSNHVRSDKCHTNKKPHYVYMYVHLYVYVGIERHSFLREILLLLKTTKMNKK